MKYLLLLLLLIISFGCSSLKDNDAKPASALNTNLKNESEKVSSSKTNVANESIYIKGETGQIGLSADAGKKEFPSSNQWDTIKNSASKISSSADKLLEEAKKLGGIELNLNTANLEVEKFKNEAKKFNEIINSLKKEIENHKKTIKDYEDGAIKKQQTIWMSVAAFSAIGLVVGIFLMIYASKELGIAIAASSLILSCVSYFMAVYALIVAAIGGITLLFVIGYLIHYLHDHKKALEESVTSFEFAKDKVWSTDEEIKKMVAKLQSVKTKQIINNVKLNKGIK